MKFLNNPIFQFLSEGNLLNTDWCKGHVIGRTLVNLK